MIAIFNYGVGNLTNIKNSLDKIGARVDVIDKKEDIKKYKKLILPGVGAFKTAICNLKKMNANNEIREFIKAGNPTLGICLGMQIMFTQSYEFGEHKGLDIINGKVVKIKKFIKVPHVGWNKVFIQHSSPLLKNLPDSFYLYFTHSYHVKCDDSYIIGKTYYHEGFASIVQKGSLFCIQAHPEKSHTNGLLILENFMRL